MVNKPEYKILIHNLSEFGVKSPDFTKERKKYLEKYIEDFLEEEYRVDMDDRVVVTSSQEDLDLIKKRGKMSEINKIPGLVIVFSCHKNK